MAIADAVDPAAHDGLMEIEILPQSMFPPGASVLRDASAVAINKSSLKAAYLEALDNVSHATYVSDDAKHLLDYETIVEALRSLAVLILLQPEHLMATNLRKSLLAPVCVKQTGVRIARHPDLMRLEKTFIDSLLTSPLNTHNKSPTLWSHRRWVYTRLFRFGFTDVLEDLTGVVMVAGEKHPRNYYAWNHARYLMDLVDWRYEEEKQEILDAVVDWCKRHHDDISGWSFLQCLLLAERRYEQGAVRCVLQDVLHLAQSLCWTNESVWVFLRTIAASKVTREPEYREFLRTVAALEAGIGDQTAKRVLKAAARWCADYRQGWKAGS